MKFEIITVEKFDFISLDRIKKFLAIHHNHDDELLQDMLEIAVNAAENYIGSFLKNTLCKIEIYKFLYNEIEIPYSPIDKIVEIKLTRLNDTELFLKENDYILDSYNNKLKFYQAYIVKKAEIKFYLGFQKIPMPIIHGVLEHIAKLYDIRGEEKAIPLSAKSLYQSYKKVRI